MRVDWSSKAEDDLLRIWIFLSQRNTDLADRIESRLNDAAELLGQFPRLGRVGRMPIDREFSLPDIQYVLEYRVEDTRVLIRRVRSTRENKDTP